MQVSEAAAKNGNVTRLELLIVYLQDVVYLQDGMPIMLHLAAWLRNVVARGCVPARTITV